MRLIDPGNDFRQGRAPATFAATLPKIMYNQLRETVRYFKHQPNPIAWALLGVIALIAGFALVTTGMKFNRITILLGYYVPVAIFNDYLLSVFVSLFGIRFLFQRSPRFKVQPYMHLPLRRWQLVAYFQFSSIFTIHNLYPLLFLVPFWSQYILPYYSLEGSLYWLGAILLTLILSTFLNNWVRSVLTNSELVFVLLACAVWVLVAADTVFDTLFINHSSYFLFTNLLEGDGVLILLVAASSVFVLVLSSFSLYNSLIRSNFRAVPSRRGWRILDRILGRSPVGALALIEIKMMWRNRRPRHYLLMSVLFSTAYLLFLLINPETSTGAIFGAIIGLFASGGFALNYGQLMFAWESTFFDGLMARHVRFEDIVKAKFMILQFSCIVLFLFSLPVFVLLRPELIPLHIAFLFYNMGITSVLIMLLAIRNRKRVDIQKGGSFFNYEGFSAAHWIWLLPVAIPPTVLLYLLRGSLQTSVMLIIFVGLASMLCTNLWVDFFAIRVYRYRHPMATGFRSYGR